MSWTIDNKSAPPYSPPGMMYGQSTSGFPMQQPVGMMSTMPQQQQQLVAFAQPPMQQQQFTPIASLPQQQQQFLPINPALQQQQLMASQMFGSTKKQCQHSYKTEYGMIGIITAVACFPLGLLALLCDKKEVCRKCATARNDA